MSDKRYFVYRFLNNSGDIVYVGRTKNLKQRFIRHSHLTKEVMKIEYIECKTEADMVWKEIYYINLFNNKSSTNVSDVYESGVTLIPMNDRWKLYNDYHNSKNVENNNSIEKYQKYVIDVPKYDYDSLIHIVENEKLNSIGNQKYDLTKAWFAENENSGKLIQLKKNVYNFFRNTVPHNHSNDNLWTTFYEYRHLLNGKGYTKGYITNNEEDTNDYINRVNVAYLSNIFYPVSEKHNIQIDEDNFALSEMLQFIWRAAIRDGKEIWVYIPSIRMRDLLKKWINKNTYPKEE